MTPLTKAQVSCRIGFAMKVHPKLNNKLRTNQAVTGPVRTGDLQVSREIFRRWAEYGLLFLTGRNYAWIFAYLYSS